MESMGWNYGEWFLYGGSAAFALAYLVISLVASGVV